MSQVRGAALELGGLIIFLAVGIMVIYGITLTY